ncbi:hypothetical protein SAMD00019534_118280 [Acytostelium subglobosum LB1]|uniref:hypothetical protein n=1 Tax=Acytostelium subglobosum LB1 TaxID=1410327 RepID=UPI00064480FD|nr:hypothetical protein SAMD00019534_118280 [Acytostelium subglobosum LB1]GAM28652.1 hypothetical protein SAMD00019534_118280 [Acytostelium subglobosum LB1]|eukprot:XP_012748430.1 hypothetical protein SAMD00019534_118280 [Acytostelium subglobosum LB1]
MEYGDVETLLSELAKSLGIKKKSIINKAKELMRKATIRQPQGLGGCEICKPTACVYLAYQTLNILKELDLPKLIGQCGTTDKLFYLAVRNLQNILSIHVPELIEMLPELKSHTELVEQTLNLLALYKSNLGATANQLDLANVEYTCSALYVMTQQNMIYISQIKFLDICKFSKAEFDRIVGSIQEHCYAGRPLPITSPKLVLKLPPPLSPTGKTSPPKKRVRSSLDNKQPSSQDSTPPSSGTTEPSTTTTSTTSTTSTKSLRHSQSKVPPPMNDGSMTVEEERLAFKKVKDDNYQQWRDKVLEENRKEKENKEKEREKEKEMEMEKEKDKPSVAILNQSDISSFFQRKNKQQQPLPQEQTQPQQPKPEPQPQPQQQPEPQQQQSQEHAQPQPQPQPLG